MKRARLLKAGTACAALVAVVLALAFFVPAALDGEASSGDDGRQDESSAVVRIPTVAVTAEAASRVRTDNPYNKFNNGSAVELDEGVMVDGSKAAYGYIGIKGSYGSGPYAGNRLKVQITCTETYTYDLTTNGKPNYYPLNQGNGSYDITVYRNVEGNSYATVGTATLDATMINDHQPFMHANSYCNFTKKSKAVKKAKKLCKKKKSDTAKVSAIYKWLSKKIKYDYKKAATVESGYIPNPDKTLKSKKGICFDYASLAAAMMRSQGIPCKLMTGYVAPDDAYHSWNMIYVKTKGWIAAEIKAKTGKYGRIDVTFAAAGAGAYVGNGSNYVDRYEY